MAAHPWSTDEAFVSALKKREYLGKNGQLYLSEGVYLYLHELYTDGRDSSESGETEAMSAKKKKDVSEPVATSDTEQDYESLASNEPKWKKRREFDGETCGYVGCNEWADGYVSGVRSTKEGASDKKKLWFGPACTKCVRKWHKDLVPLSLAELARQRNGASDLALALDLEVGEVRKRLAAENIDDRGNPLSLQKENMTDTQTNTDIVSREEQHTIAVVVPHDVIEAVQNEMQGTLAALSDFVIRSQDQMNYANNYLQRVKGLHNDIDDRRKAVAKPFRKQIEAIQAYFKPALESLSQVETQLKQRIQEGISWSQQMTAQSYQQAQQALSSGDVQRVAVATQQAMAADIALPKGLSVRFNLCFKVVDPSQLPGQFWSPDLEKIQAAIDAGYTSIPGVRVWEDQTIAARAGV